MSQMGLRHSVNDIEAGEARAAAAPGRVLDRYHWASLPGTSVFYPGWHSNARALVMQIDWNSVFLPSLGIAEIVARGTLMYLGLFIILRFMARRQAGHFGPADLLVIVLIADAAQNGLGKEYQSVTEGLVLVMTIVAWEYLIDWLAYRFSALRPYLRPRSLTLVKDGRIVEEAMRKEMLSMDELESQLRQQQVENIAEIKLAKLEGDGRLSVLRREAPPARG